MVPSLASFSVICAYKAQVDLIKSKITPEIKAAGFKTEKVGTIDSMQGYETDFGLLSITKTNFSGQNYLEDSRRINVALTRARFGLIIFGKRDEVRENPHFADLLELPCVRCADSLPIAK